MDGVIGVSLKFLFLLWLVAPIPEYNGTQVIFDNAVVPTHGLITQGCHDIKQMTLTSMIYVLDDVIQPVMTSVMSLGHDIMTLTIITYEACYDTVVPPISCASVMMTHLMVNTPGYLAQTATDTLNYAIIMVESAFILLIDGFNYVIESIWSLFNIFIDIFLNLFEDPINSIRSYAITITNGCKFLFKKFMNMINSIIAYYQYNQHFPVYFSDVLKSFKNFLWIKYTQTVHQIQIFFKPIQETFVAHVLPLLAKSWSILEYCFYLSINAVSDLIVRIQPPICNFFTTVLKYSKSSFDKITEYLGIFMDSTAKYAHILFDSIINLIKASSISFVSYFKTFLDLTSHYSVIVFNSSIQYSKILYEFFLNYSKLSFDLTINYSKVFYNLVLKCSISCISYIQSFPSICLNYCVIVVNTIVKYLILLYENIVNLSVMIFKIITNHFQQSQKQPRLFSQVFKQMIKMK